MNNKFRVLEEKHVLIKKENILEKYFHLQQRNKNIRKE